MAFPHAILVGVFSQCGSPFSNHDSCVKSTKPNEDNNQIGNNMNIPTHYGIIVLNFDIHNKREQYMDNNILMIFAY